MLPFTPRLAWIRRSAFVLFGLLLSFFLTHFPVHSQENAPWKVATEPTFPPFEMKDEQTGGLQGFDIDLMNAIGQETNHAIEFVTLPFDGIIPALQSKTVDAAISGMTITAERSQSIDFSRPYFKAGLAIAVRTNTTGIQTFDDLQGKRIAVQIGTTGAAAAADIEGASIVTFDSAALALQELLNGKVDAVVNDLPVTLYAINEANLGGIQVVGEMLTEEYYGIATPKQSSILPQINDGLSRLIDKGTYAEIYRKWFDADPPTLPAIAPALDAANSAASTPSASANTPVKSRPPKSNSSFSWIRLFQNLIRGAGVTLALTSFSFFFGLIGGALVAFALISPYKPLRWICRIYVDFFRGTPMLVQLFMIYFGLPALFQGLGLSFSFDRFPAAVTALSLNVAAYLAEIFRGGIQSIDRGQWEAGESLAMNPIEAMQYVIFPQAFRRILPPLGNEFITLIKDTSLAAVIGFDELFRQGQLIVATTYKAFEVYLAVALVYLIMTSIASWIFKYLEAQMDPLGKAQKQAARSAAIAQS